MEKENTIITGLQMEKEKQIIIEGVTINLNTKPEELMATGKFEKHDGRLVKTLSANEWIKAFGTLFSGKLHFGPDFIDISLYPKLDIPLPGYPNPDYEKASWDYCKTIIEKNFDNVIYKEDIVSSTFTQGEIYTQLIGNHTKSEFSGGYISIEIRGDNNV